MTTSCPHIFKCKTAHIQMYRYMYMEMCIVYMYMYDYRCTIYVPVLLITRLYHIRVHVHVCRTVITLCCKCIPVTPSSPLLTMVSDPAGPEAGLLELLAEGVEEWDLHTLATACTPLAAGGGVAWPRPPRFSTASEVLLTP